MGCRSESRGNQSFDRLPLAARQRNTGGSPPDATRRTLECLCQSSLLCGFLRCIRFAGAGWTIASRHSGVKAVFNQHYIKPGAVAKENGQLYNRPFDLRQEGDDLDFVNLTAEDLEPLVEKTADFINTLRKLVSEN